MSSRGTSSAPSPSTSSFRGNWSDTGGAGAGNLSSAHDDSDSDNEEAWDEVDVTVDNRPSAALAAATAAASEGISIVISKGGESGKGKGKRKSDGSTTRERMIRQERHKVHAITLFTVGKIRNAWLNDPLLHARLLSLVPLHLQNAFNSFNRNTHPNERDRSRLFDHALKDLLSWWWQSFDLEPGGIIRRLASEVEKEIKALDASYEKGKSKSKGKGKAKVRDFAQELQDSFGGESVRGSKSLMRRAVEKKGSRDMSAQLFTAVCRALGIPARLIFSLQPIDWHAPSAANKGKRKVALGDLESFDDSDASLKKGKGKQVQKKKGVSGKASTASSAKGSEMEDDSDIEIWEDGRGSYKYTLPPVNLRRSKPAKRALNRSPSPNAQALSRPPAFWTEVWSRANREWIPVDSVRKRMRCRSIMEPPRASVENQLLYAVAYEEDGSVRDVTPRYAKHYSTYTVKARVPSKRGTDWFAELLSPHHRSFQLNRDREEDEELGTRKANEPMPTSVAGFKNHPTYVLEQHLHRDEALLPSAQKLGMFRGTEVVYARSAVISLKSTENYWRIGRVIKPAEIPMKFVKQRTVTINKKRVEELQKMDGGEVDQQPLYSFGQTELYVPPPVKDGKIPRNDFGNIDLYVPSMLPKGAVHIPNKGAAKCAKTLGIDYADAITGFEFRQRRAVPTITGIVVAEEVAEVVLEAVANSEELADEKEFAKRQDRVLKRWKKLILVVRIRQRLRASYKAPQDQAVPQQQESQFGNKRKRDAPEASKEVESPPKKRLIVKPPTPSTSNGTKLTPFPKITIAVPPPKPPAPAPTRSSIKLRRAPSREVNSAAASPQKRSTSGRTLRFTMSTETAVQAKEREEARKNKEAEDEKKRIEEIVITETESDGGSDNSLELNSDF